MIEDKKLEEVLAKYFDLNQAIEGWELSSLRHLELISDLEALISHEFEIDQVIKFHNDYTLLLGDLKGLAK